MKKYLSLLAVVAVFIGSSVLADEDTPCMIRQKNAASYELAQTLNVAVQSVKVVSFEYGIWTEMPGDNSGRDQVTVSAKKDNKTYKVTYVVTADQIGRTDDCTISGIR